MGTSPSNASMGRLDDAFAEAVDEEYHHNVVDPDADHSVFVSFLTWRCCALRCANIFGVVWMLWEAYVLYHETSVTSPEDNLSMFQGTPLQYVKPQRFEHIIRWGQLQANIATFFVVVSVFISGVAQRDSW